MGMDKSYYKGKSGITVDQFVADFDLSFARGSIVKYVVRAGKKEGAPEIVDLKKAKDFIEAEIQRVEQNLSKDNLPF